MIVVLAAVEELVYRIFVVGALLVVLREKVGKAKFVELAGPAKVDDGGVRGGPASLVLLAINVPPRV